MMRPSVLAVWLLMTNSTLLACTTGRINRARGICFLIGKGSAALIGPLIMQD
jgi:hypothetical protein